jgi:hypothetical protein
VSTLAPSIQHLSTSPIPMYFQLFHHLLKRKHALEHLLFISSSFWSSAAKKTEWIRAYQVRFGESWCLYVQDLMNLEFILLCVSTLWCHKPVFLLSSLSFPLVFLRFRRCTLVESARLDSSHMMAFWRSSHLINYS